MVAVLVGILAVSGQAEDPQDPFQDVLQDLLRGAGPARRQRRTVARDASAAASPWNPPYQEPPPSSVRSFAKRSSRRCLVYTH